MARDAASLAIPGVNPPRQKRSRETVETLLAAGKRLLLLQDLEALSIEELCAAAGASVGAFYSRFESKEAYFNALQFLACRQSDEFLEGAGAPEKFADATLEAMCRAIAESGVGWMRANEGVVRAALKHAGTQPSAWTPFKELGRRVVRRWTPVLLPRIPGRSRGERERALGFAFQILFGTLVNIILHDPGPLSLADRDLPRHLARAMVRYLDKN